MNWSEFFMFCTAVGRSGFFSLSAHLLGTGPLDPCTLSTENTRWDRSKMGIHHYCVQCWTASRRQGTHAISSLSVSLRPLTINGNLRHQQVLLVLCIRGGGRAHPGA